MIKSFCVAILATITLLNTPAGSATTYLLTPEVEVVGQLADIQSTYEDTLVDIARRFGVGFEEIKLANPGVDPWLPGENTAVLLPTQFVLPRNGVKGLVINLAEYRMYYFTDSKDGPQVSTFPISIGRMDWETPLGVSRVVAKAKNPSWYPPQSVRDEHEAEGRKLPGVVPPGPDNPLGDYAMRLSIPGYLIHGTNKPAGVGMRVTHGCIRMLPEDIAWLFPQVSVDTPVRIVNEPYKLGWLGDTLYLEVHPPLEEDAEAEAAGLTRITELYIAATRDRQATIDWELVERVWRERRGVATAVGSLAPATSVAANAGQADAQ